MNFFKIILISFTVLLFSLSQSYANLSEIPMSLNNWNVISSSEVENTSDGLKAVQNGWHGVCGISTKKYFNFVDSETFIKFKIITSDHVFVEPGVYIEGKQTLTAWRLTTKYASSGSTVISSDTWYFLRIKINSDKTFNVTTAINNYDTEGGTIIKNQSGSVPYTETLPNREISEWEYIQNTRILINFNSITDSSAAIIAGEAKTTALPISLNDGLIAYYPFDGNCMDLSGNENNGTIKGANLITDKFGILDHAYSFQDNAIDHILLPHNILNNLQTFSFSAYLSIESFNNSNNLVSCARSDNDNSFVIQYNQVEGNGWRLLFGNSLFEFEPNSVMDDKQWHHIVIIKQIGIGKLYVDGIKIGNDLTLPENRLQIDPGGLIIGQDQDCIGGCFVVNQGWEGKVDELRIYDRALSEDIINELYEQFIRECNYDDRDEDGVIDIFDECPNTIQGTAVNNNGCKAITLYLKIEELLEKVNQLETNNSIMNYTITELNSKIDSMFTLQQTQSMVRNILQWGDLNGDEKIGLEEAIEALMMTSGIIKK